MKEAIIKVLKSRTILTLLFLIIFNVFSAISGMIDPMVSVIINTALGTIAGYFRINTKATF